MKKLSIALLFILFTLSTNAQKIFSVSSQFDADVKVYVTDSQFDADLLVYRVDSQFDAGNNDGKWTHYKEDGSIESVKEWKVGKLVTN